MSHATKRISLMGLGAGPSSLSLLRAQMAGAMQQQSHIRCVATAAAGTGPSLRLDTINPQLRAAEYAVRGEVVLRAAELRKALQSANHGLPFDEIIACNIGNPHELGQSAVTFFREVLALCTYPALLQKAPGAFSKDAVRRAELYLKNIKGGTGAYTESRGLEVVRKEVAAYIKARDGYESNPEHIFLTDGASSGVKMLLNALIRNSNDGVLIPIPQYPLYSATLTLLGGSQVGYLLDEKNNWSMPIQELTRAYDAATKKGITVRALVVINPGNPTGQCLPVENMKQIVTFCQERGIVLMADEVYQTNIYSATPFTSFKRVINLMGGAASKLELVSFHSVSKGFVGECGRRGGYLEMCNIDAKVQEQLYKLASISLCSNVDGQIMVGLMVNPPREGEESHSLYKKETEDISASLQRRAKKLVAGLNQMAGVQCNEVQGALYAFPAITLPPKAVQAARALGKSPDMFYSLQLLEHTGICVVPGSGFGQADGTFHFRTTILPPERQMDVVIKRMQTFHAKFMSQYA